MTDLPKRLPEPRFKEQEGVEVDDPTVCPKSQSGHHRYLLESGPGVSHLSCLYCRKPADPMPPEGWDRWVRHDY